MKKLLALVLAAVMLLGLVPAVSVAEDAVKVTMFYPTSRPMNEYTELTRAAVKEAIGVDMDLIQGGDNWKQQLALYISGGTMPDLVAFMDASTFQGYAAEGAFADLSGKIENYPNIMKYLGSVEGHTAEEMLKRTTIDGVLYGIPGVTVARSYYTENVRTDWLAKVGLSVPETLEDWVNVMRAFTNEDPDGDGVKNTYGFSGSRQYNSLTPFFGAFGTRPDQYYSLEGDKVVTSVTSPAYKEALACIRDLYAEGLIDPEMFTANDQQTYEKWVRGEFGLWNSWWSGAGNSVARYGYLDSNPEDSIAILNPPVGADGKSGVIAQDPCENYMAIGYTCQNVDAVLSLIDYAMSDIGHRTLMWGIEGQFWTQDADGNIDWYFGVDGKDKLGNEISDMQVYRFFYNIPVENSVRRLGDTMSARLYLESSQFYPHVPVYEDLFIGLTSEDYVTYHSDLENYVKESGIKFIVGEADLDKDWDSYVNTYNAMGGAKVASSLLDAYNAVNGTAYTLAD